VTVVSSRGRSQGERGNREAQFEKTETASVDRMALFPSTWSSSSLSDASSPSWDSDSSSESTDAGYRWSTRRGAGGGVCRSKTPYSDATGERAKTTATQHIKRPMNAFMVWSKVNVRKCLILVFNTVTVVIYNSIGVLNY